MITFCCYAKLSQGFSVDFSIDCYEQVVAIKQLNHDGLQGFQEFIVEVLMLSLLHHPNLVTLIGYCTDGDQRLLVYEYMPMGSVEDHLFGNVSARIMSLRFFNTLEYRIMEANSF